MAFPISREEIAKTENSIGVTFPDSFLVAMTINNGGEIIFRNDNWILIPFKNTSTRKTLIRTCNDIINELKTARQWEQFPKNAIPFAFNECGDYLVFLTTNQKNLSDIVHYWHHETGTLSSIGSFEELNSEPLKAQ